MDSEEKEMPRLTVCSKTKQQFLPNGEVLRGSFCKASKGMQVQTVDCGLSKI